jgi:hypothetical protein
MVARSFPEIYAAVSSTVFTTRTPVRNGGKAWQFKDQQPAPDLA